MRQATSLFRERFGSAPTVLVSAPGRVNLIGEHLDYNGGPVLPFAIERRTAAVAAHGEGWRVVSAVDGSVHALDLEAPLGEHWTGYVAGVIRVLARAGLAPRGAQLAVASTVPIGAGLSSSAALTVSVARALTGLAGRRVPPETLAEVAYHAEHDEVGVKCGRMDQTISALAKPGYALLFETATGRLEHVPLPSRVWVFETGVAHRLTGGELNTRRRECEEALRLVERRGPAARTLADVPYDDLATLLRELPPPFSLRLRHVVTETDRTRRVAAALARRDLLTAGGLLVAGHASLRDDYQSSCPEADLLVDALVRHGAYGARLTGAGWGGAVIALAPEAAEHGMLTAVQAEYRAAYGRVPVAWVTKAAAGVRSEK